MNVRSTLKILAPCLLAFALGTSGLNAAVGDVSPLSRSEIGQVEAVLGKNLKGKSTVQSGTKQEVDGGWKITCVANVGSGGAYDLVVMTERTITLGYIDSQKPHVAPAAKAPEVKGAGKKK